MKYLSTPLLYILALMLAYMALFWGTYWVLYNLVKYWGVS